MGDTFFNVLKFFNDMILLILSTLIYMFIFVNGFHKSLSRNLQPINKLLNFKFAKSGSGNRFIVNALKVGARLLFIWRSQICFSYRATDFLVNKLKINFDYTFGLFYFYLLIPIM